MPRKERNGIILNVQVKLQKAEKKCKKKNRSKEQGHQIENSNKYGRYLSNYFHSHFEHQWSKYTN